MYRSLRLKAVLWLLATIVFHSDAFLLLSLQQLRAFHNYNLKKSTLSRQHGQQQQHPVITSQRYQGSNHCFVYYKTLVGALSASDDNDHINNDNDNPNEEEYRNAFTQFLSQFLPSNRKDNLDMTTISSGTTTTTTTAPSCIKISKLPLETLAELLDAELLEKEWFVTGNVNASYFSDDFRFQDPDVKVEGIQEYARGVARLFDQSTSRAEIISTVAHPSNHTITVTWRLSGKVNVGPAGLVIKPYICYTDFQIDETTGLIRFQEDRFDIPGWDILLSALFPFLIGIVTAPPAPPVSPRR